MRKRTRADLEQAAQAAERENTLLHIALQCMVNGEIDATERCRVPTDKMRLELRLVRATGAHGGIVLVTTSWTDTEQRPSTSVHYLEDFHLTLERGVPRWELSAAVDKLFVARQRLLDAQKGAA